MGEVPQPGGYPAGIASTCYGYAAGGMPLAFTQEDFLVCKYFVPTVKLQLQFFSKPPLKYVPTDY